MYSEYKSIQILIDLLKQFEIKDIILSPGGSDIPLIHSIETDTYFRCHSVIDERSAAYFALGVAQQTQNPVACVCTSGTAVCNYLPGITEAFYQSAPVLAITCDKNPYYQDQLETQKINQEKIFTGVVKKSVSLPIVKCKDDDWLCNRLVNEALLELTHNGCGPCHINIPVVGSYNNYNCSVLPKQRKVSYMDLNCGSNTDLIFKRLNNARKIMVVVGQNIYFSSDDRIILESFFEKFNCIFAVENISNLNCNGCVFTYPVTETNFDNKLLPDLVISIGNNLAAYNLKPALRANFENMNNWLVCESGIFRDAYKSLEFIFQIKPIDFFKRMVQVAENQKNDSIYYNMWSEYSKKLQIPEFEYSNLYVAQQLAKKIPDNSILHLAILNSTRVMQFFPLSNNVTVYSNVGALGIDGCMSTFAGQSAVCDGFSYLLIGDLSFFYDMNSAALDGIGPNSRIVLLNNGGGSEFHFFLGKEKIPTINDYICAEHTKVATGWIASLGFDYYAVSNKEELDVAFEHFDKKTDRPQFVEIFGDMEFDAKNTRQFYAQNHQRKNSFTIKSFVKRILPNRQIDKAKKIIDILKEK